MTTARCPGVATLNVSWLQLIKGRILVLSQRECVAIWSYKDTETGHHTVSGWDVTGVDRFQNHIRSQFGPGAAVLVSSRVLQATPHIVGLVPSALGHRHCLITSGHNTLHVGALSLMITSRDSTSHLGGVLTSSTVRQRSNHQASPS